MNRSNNKSRHIVNNQEEITAETNYFSFQNTAANRFIGKCNIYEHSKTLKVRVEYAAVCDLNKFASQFKKQFERRTGKGSVKNISILQYKFNKALIHQLDINITFQSFLSYGYLNDITFPTNWTFFEQVNKHTKPKYSTHQQRMATK